MRKPHLIFGSLAVTGAAIGLIAHFARAQSASPTVTYVDAQVAAVLSSVSATSDQTATINTARDNVLAAMQASQDAQSQQMTQALAIFTADTFDPSAAQSLAASYEALTESTDQALAVALVTAFQTLTPDQRVAVASALQSTRPVRMWPSFEQAQRMMHSQLDQLSTIVTLTPDQQLPLTSQLDRLVYDVYQLDKHLDQDFDRAVALFAASDIHSVALTGVPAWMATFAPSAPGGVDIGALAGAVEFDKRNRQALLQSVMTTVATVMPVLSTSDRQSIAAAITASQWPTPPQPGTRVPSSPYCTADLNNDAQNCGWCGHDCGAHRYCSAGACIFGSPTLPTRFNMTANELGDYLSVDFDGNVWVDMDSGSNPGVWQNVYAPIGDPIRYGIIANEPIDLDDTKMGFAVGASGQLWMLDYHDDWGDGLGPAWRWNADFGMSSNCQAIVDQPVLADVLTQTDGVILLGRCQSNLLAELSIPSGSWTEHLAPAGVTFARSPAMAGGSENEDMTDATGVIGAVVFDTTGALWSAVSAPGVADWNWTEIPAPAGVAFVGDPSLVYDRLSGYMGGLFVGSDGQAWELQLSGGTPAWTPHGFPSTSNCQRATGQGFSMGIDPESGVRFGVVRCAGLNADGVNSIARLTFDAAAWNWDTLALPPPPGSTANGVYMYGDPWAIVYRTPATGIAPYEALFSAFDTPTGTLSRAGWNGPSPVYGSWSFIDHD